MPPRLKILILALVICVGCSKKTVTLTDDRGHALKYDCAHFESQAKTDEDTHLILFKTAETLRRASAEDDNALTRSLRLGRQFRDIRRLEELIVADECAHQK